jgi:hypothetical protein
MPTPRQKLHLTAAGPSRWLSLIADDHTQTNPAAAAQLISSATRGGINPTSLEGAFTSLAKLTAATIILSNAIAVDLTISAQKVFIDARAVAKELNARSTPTPITGGDTTQISTVAFAFNTQAGTEALIRLLIDTIRIANHITGK